MSTTAAHPEAAPAADTLDTAVVVSWKAPIVYGVITVLAAVLFIVARQDGDAVFRISSPGEFIQLPEVVLGGVLTGAVCTVLLALVTLVSVLMVRARRRPPIWLAVVFAVVFMVGFLTWAAAGATTAVIPLTGLLAGGLSLSVPLIFGAMCGVLSERVGVVNIAIEGQLLAGAFTSAVVATMTGNPFIGLIAAAVAGVLVSFVLAAFAIKYFVDQVIVGVVLNVLVVGLTSFLFSQLLAPNAAFLNSPPRFPRLPIPVLADIPIIGPMLFNQTVIVYLMYVTVIAVYIGLFHTRWGLRLRAVGEHPQAADTVGINIARTRFWNVSLGGAIAGLGGAFFTLGSVGAFNKEMTAGAGYIALAAVIFGQWDPIRATLAALLFGFASNLQNTLGVIGSPVPSEFMLMLPYVVTIFAVAGLVGKVRGPAAAGKPYVKG
ncbi:MULTISPECIES: ABC transporter permease [Microbacterium]|uniref:ABC transporter permease n=1 Tax=Microbacterium mcarthurae TaxID=3035918 RepID=A0ABW9GIF8_9MICO|nr:ABC transporter permease [Microbacterium sp. ACRRU]MCG7416431.1 ABC transporter permease [Microbacterium sp. ACRRU]